MLFRLLICLPALYIAMARPSWAISVKDFMRVTDRVKENAAPVTVGLMSIEKFLALPKWKKNDPAETRYFDGFRDALYGFNGVLQDEGFAVFCPVADDPPMASVELRQRIEAKLDEEQATQRDFGNYVRTTSLGMVALEVLGAVYPCKADQGEMDDNIELPQ